MKDYPTGGRRNSILRIFHYSSFDPLFFFIKDFYQTQASIELSKNWRIPNKFEATLNKKVSRITAKLQIPILR